MTDQDYNPSFIEAAIQKSWKDDDVYRATSSSSKGCRQQSDGDGNRSEWVTLCCRECGSGRNREEQGGSMDETGISYKRSIIHQQQYLEGWRRRSHGFEHLRTAPDGKHT